MGYPYLVGLHYEGVYMAYPYPKFCLCALLGPYSGGPQWIHPGRDLPGGSFLRHVSLRFYGAWV